MVVQMVTTPDFTMPGLPAVSDAQTKATCGKKKVPTVLRLAEADDKAFFWLDFHDHHLLRIPDLAKEL